MAWQVIGLRENFGNPKSWIELDLFAFNLGALASIDARKRLLSSLLICEDSSEVINRMIKIQNHEGVITNSINQMDLYIDTGKLINSGVSAIVIEKSIYLTLFGWSETISLVYLQFRKSYFLKTDVNILFSIQYINIDLSPSEYIYFWKAKHYINNILRGVGCSLRYIILFSHSLCIESKRVEFLIC